MAVTVGRTDRVLIVHPDPAVRRDVENVLRRAHNHSIAGARQPAQAKQPSRAAASSTRASSCSILPMDRPLALSVANELRRPDRLSSVSSTPFSKREARRRRSS